MRFDKSAESAAIAYLFICQHTEDDKVFPQERRRKNQREILVSTSIIKMLIVVAAIVGIEIIAYH